MTIDHPQLEAPEIVSHPQRSGWYRLRTSLWVPASRDRVFEFFADAFQLETITPPWLHFHVVTPRPITMSAGLLIDYRLRIRGVPLRWQSRIDGWEPPLQFVDEQVRGPYAAWQHLHTFEEQQRGADGTRGTLVGDRVDYAVPGGAIVNWLFVHRQLLQIFAFRRAKLIEVFGSAPKS